VVDRRSGELRDCSRVATNHHKLWGGT